MHTVFWLETLKVRDLSGRPRDRWEDNIRIDLRQIMSDVDWIYLAQNRDQWRAVVNTVMNFGVQ
jgi:hypothetical protein